MTKLLECATFVFKAFEEEFGGKVFIVFSLDGEIANVEIKRLTTANP